MSHPYPTRRATIISRSILAVVFLAAFVGMCAATKAAERERFEIWAVRSSGKYLTEDQPNWVRVSFESYPTRSDCMEAIVSVRLDRHLKGASGWRLTCQPIEKPLF